MAYVVILEVPGLDLAETLSVVTDFFVYYHSLFGKYEQNRSWLVLSTFFPIHHSSVILSFWHYIVWATDSMIK
jgi:hypothetical protein